MPSKFLSGSAPMLVDTFEAWRQRTGHTIVERYGMSETVMLTSNPCDPADGPRRAGSGAARGSSSGSAVCPGDTGTGNGMPANWVSAAASSGLGGTPGCPPWPTTRGSRSMC